MSKSPEALFDAPLSSASSEGGKRPERQLPPFISQSSYEGYLGLMELQGNQVFAAIWLGIDINQAIGEFMIHRSFPNSDRVGVPEGNGEDVLLFPGFGNDNSYLSGLKNWVDMTGSKGHFALPKNERNVIWKKNVDQALVAAFKIFNENGGRMITGFGHSAGGGILKIAKEVAEKEYGKKIFRRIITAASPLQFPQTGINEGNEHVTNAALSIMDKDPQGLEMDRLLFSYLPEESKYGELISLYSKNDPVVPIKHAYRDDATNIEIGGSHTGMAWNINLRRNLGKILAS